MKKGWEKGRQHGIEYYKKTLWNFKIGNRGFDCYILHYLPDTELPPHKDPIEGKHYRMNITLRGKNEFKCEEQLVNWKFIHIFRPDLFIHSLKIKTETYKLSLGFAKFD